MDALPLWIEGLVLMVVHAKGGQPLSGLLSSPSSPSSLATTTQTPGAGIPTNHSSSPRRDLVMRIVLYAILQTLALVPLIGSVAVPGAMPPTIILVSAIVTVLCGICAGRVKNRLVVHFPFGCVAEMNVTVTVTAVRA